MANQESNDRKSDRRNVMEEGSSLSGSTMRDNASTEKALHPDQQPERPEEEIETVDQDPGERQKENQNDSKDDPLAA